MGLTRSTFLFLAVLVIALCYDFHFVKSHNPQFSQLIYMSDEKVHITRFKTADCDQITRQKLYSLIYEYPNVILTCEKQMTVLYPAKFNEDTYTSHLDDVPQRWNDCIDGKRKCLKYFFTEVSINMTERVTDFRYPVMPCVRFPEEKHTGFSEIALGLARSRSGLTSKGISLVLPLITLTFSDLGEISSQKVILLDHTCDFDQIGNRPVVSFSTVTGRVHDRLWVVDMRKRQPVVRYPWRESESEFFSPLAPLVACVSERYVPGVCEWDQEQAMDPWGEAVPMEES